MLLDSGNFSDNPTPTGDLKTRTLLEGMQRMGYAAVNVGERDVKLGYAAFIERTQHVDLPFVSANIVRQDTQQPIFEPHLVVEAQSADGKHRLKVGVIGVARYNPIFLKAGPDGSNMVIAHPLPAVQRELERLREKNVDFVVLLAALHKDDAARIIREVDGIDYVIGSYGGVFTDYPDKIGESWLVYSGNQGKRLGETRIFFNAEKRVDLQVTMLHFLTQAYPADESVQQFVDNARETGRTRHTAQVAAPRAPFVGSRTCQPCHAQAFEQWSATAHARSVTTLRDEQKDGDAACQSCHVTGAGAPGGFAGLGQTPHLAHVGCESCHGPGRDHLDAPQRAYGDVDIATCTGCHDMQNSPEFDYYAYLPRVAHGSRAAR